jgi:hypothetical protein
MLIPFAFEKVEHIDNLILQLQRYREHLAAGKRIRFLPKVLPDPSGPKSVPYP